MSETLDEQAPFTDADWVRVRGGWTKRASMTKADAYARAVWLLHRLVGDLQQYDPSVRDEEVREAAAVCRVFEEELSLDYDDMAASIRAQIEGGR